ncbi:hypothetical protein D3C77_503210 [compost metagenome]
MRRRSPLRVMLLVLPLWLLAGYGLRFAFLEDSRWVGLCAATPGDWQCELRLALGWLIHFRVLAWAALLAALPGFCLSARMGAWLALAGLLLGLAALVLYNASLGVFAVVIASLRLVRAESLGER